MAVPPDAPAYGLIRAGDLTLSSRRRFLAGGAFLLGFAWLPRKAWAKGEEPGLRAITPGGPAAGAAFSGFQPGGFIRIAHDGTITFIIPNVEMGQGIYTGEAMLIAEELEVGLDQIQVMAAPPNEELYAQPMLKSQATGGSTSIRGAWGPLRQAGAAARTMLIAAAAKRWRVDPATCHAQRGAVYRGPDGPSLSYGALVNAVRHQPVPQDVALKPVGQFTLIGRPLPRVDTPAKVNGTAAFGIDTRVEGMKIAAVAMSPVPGGTIRRVDDRAARALPGVVDVLRLPDAVAVVGDHFWAAKQGVEALSIDWAPGANATLSTAAFRASLKQAAEHGTPIMGRQVGDAAGAMAAARLKLDAVYELPFLAHATMEPINTTVHVRPDGCEVWVGTQVPVAAQQAAAAATGLPPEKVTIHNQLVGGGYGRRLVAESIGQAAAFAKQVSYPLKVIWTREQDIRHDLFRPAYHDQIAAGFDAKGLPAVWTDRVCGASVLQDYLPAGLPQGQLDSDAVEGAAITPYAFPATRVDWVRHDAPVKVNWWRGVGPTHNVFVVESFLDECAHANGRDPIDYRRALLQQNPRALAVLNLAATQAGWGGALPARTGRGVSLHQSFGSYAALVVEATVETSGEIRIRRLTAAIDCGIAINPDSVRAQIEGGVIFGLSAALYNGITFTDGHIDQGNFNDYRQMRIDEVPPFDISLIQSDADPGGMGEVGTVSAAPALGNAIFAATGKRLRSLPFDRAALAAERNDKDVIAIAAPTALLVGAALAGPGDADREEGR